MLVIPRTYALFGIPAMPDYGHCFLRAPNSNSSYFQSLLVYVYTKAYVVVVGFIWYTLLFLLFYIYTMFFNRHAQRIENVHVFFFKFNETRTLQADTWFTYFMACVFSYSYSIHISLFLHFPDFSQCDRVINLYLDLNFGNFP